MSLKVQYVLVTPAKNEAKTLGVTIESILRQTLRPTEWVIVSDGSTDATDRIVREFASKHDFIQLLQRPPSEKRSFASVVFATEAGVAALRCKDYKYIGLLDADVQFSDDYFEQIVERFESNPRLGLGGGMVVDVGLDRTQLPNNREDVPGAAQFFRRECFEAIGRLVAVPEGGWDALTCAKARMVGFETRLFVDLVVDHLKPRNISEGGALCRKWQMGVRDHALGYHFLFETVKCLSRVADRPLAISAIAWWLGYCSATLQRRQRHVPPDLLAFVRKEQMERLQRLFGLGKRA